VATPSTSLPERAAVLQLLRRVNDRWIGTHPDPGPNDWGRATYFSGDIALYRLLGEQRYLAYATSWAEAHQYGLLGGITTRNADNQCAGQVYLDLYEIRPDPLRIADIEACLRNMVYGGQPDRHSDWTWVDALHMAMPVFARLGKLRRDPNYWIKLYRMYNHTKRVEGGGLYAWRTSQLWWRDRRFVLPGGITSPNGERVLWSRGKRLGRGRARQDPQGHAGDRPARPRVPAYPRRDVPGTPLAPAQRRLLEHQPRRPAALSRPGDQRHRLLHLRHGLRCQLRPAASFDLPAGDRAGLERRGRKSGSQRRPARLRPASQ
jgi:hypothetical protein